MLIVCNQDQEGIETTGLILNFFHHFWPELSRIVGFLKLLHIPELKCERDGYTRYFLNKGEFKSWQKKEKISDWTISKIPELGRI